MSVLNPKELFGVKMPYSSQLIDGGLVLSSYDGKKVVHFRLNEIVSPAHLDLLGMMPNLKRFVIDVRGLDKDMVDECIGQLQLDTLRVSGGRSRVPKWKKMFRVVETY